MIRNLVYIGFVFLVGYLFGVKEVRFVKIISASMEPTLMIGDRVVTVKKERPKREEIVLIKDPVGNTEKLVKRVIGLPLETLKIESGELSVNGKRLKEPYIYEPSNYDIEIKLHENEYFLLGDNRNKSEDSSVWGPVDEDFIIGRVICRYWPYKDFKVFTRFKLSVVER